MENKIVSEAKGTELKITVIGEIDHHSAKKFRNDIDELIYYYRPKKLYLDLSQIAFMDSSGLGLILGRYTLTRELGGELIILEPTDAVKKILDLAGTSRLIKIERSKAGESIT